MTNQSTSNHLDNEATFYMDLLQVCAVLIFGDEAFFSQRGSFRYGGTAEHLGDHAVVGIEQATAFLNEVYHSDSFMSGSVARHLAINPLIQHLAVNLQPLANVRVPEVTLMAVDEGRVISTAVHYLSFETSYFFMTLVALAMDRICAYQSHITTDTREWLRSLAQLTMESSDRMPTTVNMGSMRQYTTTLAAYFARARHVGGVDRFLDENLRKKSDRFAGQPLNCPEWQLKSHDIVNRIKDAEHRALLSERYGPQTAETLIVDGIYYLKEEDYLDCSLLGFVLDGEIANSFRAGGNWSFSLSGVSPLHRKDDFIIDSHYQAIWNPVPLNVTGYYGSEGRNLPPGLSRYGDRPVARAKWSRMPKILIHDFQELTDIVDAVRESFPQKQIFFRGQGEHFRLNRSKLVNRLFYDDPEVDELSLPTYASRHKFEFDSFFAAFQLQIQGILYARFDKNKFQELRPDWKFWGPVSPFTDHEINDMYERWFRLYYSYEWEMLVIGLAQHYGIPTHGLDITNDLNVTLWFALNKWYQYQKGDTGYCWYKPLERTPRNALEEYPVLYILATDTDLKRDLDQVEYVDLPALRPMRQNAYLHYGGWGFHTNICAEDVVAAVFLSEKFKSPELPSVEWLFPDVKEDLFYGELIELKRRANRSNLQWGYQYIAEYRPESK